jgi:benzil reductase ((S)-benzoin forming)
MPDTRAIVTGHSRGLGEAIARRLLARQARVLGVSRGGNARLTSEHGDALAEATVDLADGRALLAWLDGGALERFLSGASQALLVNNAGLVQPIGPLEVQDPAAVARAVAVNVGAVLTLSAAFVAATPDAGDRRILHVSSGAGRRAYAGWSVYCASKAALDHHARAVALDRTPRLRIASVAPGVIDTDMQAEIRATAEDRFPDRQRFEDLQREGQLLSPDAAAGSVVDVLMGDRFGDEPVADVRR